MQCSIISEQDLPPLSQRPVQENSGVNCDNRDEIIVVAATGREKHGVQQRQC